MIRVLLSVWMLLMGLLAPKAMGQETVLIRNVNVISMTTEVVQKHQNVLIRDGKIQQIVNDSSQLRELPSTVIDGTDKYLIPGLSEMHYHWRNKEGGIERDFNLLLANGVTTVRNMAEYDWQDHVAIRDSIKNGRKRGPNYFTTGPYLKAGDLDTAEKAIIVVQQHHKRGYDFLKLADNLPKEIYNKVLDEAATYGIPVIGHTQREMALEYSLRMKSIEHVEEFVYLFDDEEREDVPFLEEAVQQIKASGSIIVPTLVVFDMILRYLDDASFQQLPHSQGAPYMLEGDFHYWHSEANPYIKDLKGKILQEKPAEVLLKEYFEWMKSFTHKLYEAGVPLMTGSDTFGFVVPGFSLHQEFQFLQACGMRPYDILKASTVTPADYLNSLDSEGTISEGKNANLVLLRKNPLEDIRHTQSIEGVFQKGIWYNRSQLNILLEEVNQYNK